ncbi:MAG: patatin-like phospholipase family protein [Pirellulaceae bacterium]|nr:patatin-like phospholipase family protein [Pirellulaceae bacterium]
MSRLGLALSGGGFRATVYHLGVVRFLRDAGILPNITHMTTVSGGSILGAHLALNWDRYCGTADQFTEASEEILEVVRLDVRNRILRRFPFASIVNTGRTLLRMGSVRQLTRPGLLEKYYEQFLYGDVPLSHLPENPNLHILATNLSEGCLCSFNRRGMLLQRRLPGRRDQFERIQTGLATVSMAVAASSAFPGFFPPLELNGWEVGADGGEFNRQTFTDGGVYDNLGLRMFRCLEQSSVRDAVPFRKQDFLELESVTVSLRSALGLPAGTPLRRLREKLDRYDHDRLLESDANSSDKTTELIVRGFWEIMRTDRLYRDPCFQEMQLADPGAQTLLQHVVESGRDLDLDDSLWLNRQIIESAFRKVIGRPCVRSTSQEFDGILVSDAGGKFKATRDLRRGGLVSTALRSSDILMDRVWQLELEASINASGVIYLPISEVVDKAQDRWALDPEIQRQAAQIRTDLDRFTNLEISALVQHGYCVARQICRSHPQLFHGPIESGPPWDPIEEGRADKVSSSQGESVRESSDLVTARKLRDSSRRRIWSALLSYRDWPSYAWVLLILCLAISLPTYILSMRERAAQQRVVLTAISDMSPDYRKILELLENDGPEEIKGMPFNEVKELSASDLTGFNVLSDTRIFDLRSWANRNDDASAVGYARLTVERTKENTNPILQVRRPTRVKDGIISSPSKRLKPKLFRMSQGEHNFIWGIDFDFHEVPFGGRSDLRIEQVLTPENASLMDGGGRFRFSIYTPTSLLEVWMLLPKGRSCDSFEVRAFPIGKPELAKIVVPNSQVQLALGSIATFRLIRPTAPFEYECVWKWNKLVPNQ